MKSCDEKTPAADLKQQPQTPATVEGSTLFIMASLARLGFSGAGSAFKLPDRGSALPQRLADCRDPCSLPRPN